MLQIRVELVSDPSSPNTLASFACAGRVSSLHHEVFDVAVEHAAVVIVARGQGQEVLSNLGHEVAADLALDVAQRGMESYRLDRERQHKHNKQRQRQHPKQHTQKLEQGQFVSPAAAAAAAVGVGSSVEWSGVQGCRMQCRARTMTTFLYASSRSFSFSLSPHTVCWWRVEVCGSRLLAALKRKYPGTAQLTPVSQSFLSLFV